MSRRISNVRKAIICHAIIGLTVLGLPLGIVSAEFVTPDGGWSVLSDSGLARIIGTADCCNGNTQKTDCTKNPQDGCVKCQNISFGTNPAPCGSTANGLLWLNQSYQICKISASGGLCQSTGTVTCNSTFTCVGGSPMGGKSCGSAGVCTGADSTRKCAQCSRTGTGANPVIKNTSNCVGSSGCPAS